MTFTDSPELILASASPRRKEILTKLGLTFKIIPSHVDEDIETSISPVESVKILAHRKADDVSKKINFPAIILGSDTTVVIDNLSLGKPVDYDDAFRMLQLLSGRSHTVITGLCLIDTRRNKILSESVSSEVFFKKLTETEIHNYIQTGEPMDKAGAYAIQGFASLFITKINGCYPNIVGLPIQKLSEMLKTFQIDILNINVSSKK